MRLKPVKLEMLKVTFHEKHKRKMLRFLHKIPQIQIVDPQERASMTRETEKEREIINMYNQMDRLLNYLNIDIWEEIPIEPQNLDFEDLDKLKTQVQHFLEKIQPQVDDLRNKIATNEHELDQIAQIYEIAYNLQQLGSINVEDFGTGPYFYVTAGQIKSSRVRRLEWKLKEATNGEYFLKHASLEDAPDIQSFLYPEQVKEKKRGILSKSIGGFFKGIGLLLSYTIVKPLKLVGKGIISAINTIRGVKPEEKEHEHEELTTNSVIVVGVLNEQKNLLNRLLTVEGFIEYRLPKDITGTPDEILTQLRKKLTEIKSHLENYNKKLEMIKEQNLTKLLSFHEQLAIEKQRIEISRNFAKKGTFYTFWAWIPAHKKDKIKEIIMNIDGSAQIKTEDPKLPAEDVPTLLEHNSVLQPYQDLVYAFGAPGYHERDPTILISLTFGFIFGIMFADVVQGLIVFLLGLMGRYLKTPPKPQNITDELKVYLKRGSWLLMAMGFFSMVFGVLFGSYLGLAGIHLEEKLHIKPLWFSPEEGIEVGGVHIAGQFILLEMTILIGSLHIITALLLQFLHKYKDPHEREEAIYLPGMFLIFYISLISLIFGIGLNPLEWASNTEIHVSFRALQATVGLENWYIPIPKIPIANIPILTLIISAALSFWYHLKHGYDGISEFIDYVITLISNTISYARIFAYNLVHGNLNLVTIVLTSILLTFIVNFLLLIPGINNLLFLLGFTEPLELDPKLESTPFSFIFIGMLLTILTVIPLELIASFLQTLRLHWVEFFSKLGFVGSGSRFKDYKINRRFTIEPKLVPST